MEDQFNNSLNGRLDGLRVADVAPGFDRLETWAALEARLDQPTARRRVLPVWSLVAAAALIGLLIGAASVRFLGNEEMPRITHSFRTPEDATPSSVQQELVMVPVPPPPVAVPLQPARRRKPAIPVAAALLPDPAREPARDLAHDPAPAPVAAQAPVPRAPRAAHILDIDHQARTVLLNAPPSPDRSSILEYMMVRTMPEPGVRAAPAAVFRHPD